MNFEEIYQDSTPPPWEIGGAQPALAAAIDAGEPRGPRALDLGCGTGDLAISLAQRGFEVTGIDISPTAIERARAKAAALHLDITFAVQDATNLDTSAKRFDSIFDSGLLHNLVRISSGVDAYLSALPRLAAPGATLFVLAVSSRARQGWGLSEEFLRAAFAAPAWIGTSVEEIDITALPGGEQLTLSGHLLRATTPLGYA
ncbi:ubiquinone/menaquinone biosynthesis C-methylase UbiE [Actinoplanes lutulentus]|uniref:Methyltransferase family protein n=1 Tax=Actinoplanes lutulentus TaxID=1287878 RepID=A0A327YXC2_9ACTN|nr:class I SAM-dependent methyltransferase [Actinoplanes lutulentus]MBB2940388.1 ubiquinone/menaquinone biosynthesis C-methylase UbiE [Actinoplanes lutulentus]RAK25879.1 methyltransferase family protein [Actinoplanes lutulentus]